MIFAFDPILEHYFYILYKTCSNSDIQVESQAEWVLQNVFLKVCVSDYCDTYESEPQ